MRTALYLKIYDVCRSYFRTITIHRLSRNISMTKTVEHGGWIQKNCPAIVVDRRILLIY